MRAVGKFVVPTWVSSEPAAIQLEATKNGEIVDILDLSEKQYYVIGRNKDLSTITLEHPSISKQHAAILNGTPHGLNGCSIMDLGSSNGTFLGSTPAKLELIQAQRPVLLPEGSFVKFGESSRIYTVKPFKKGNQPGTEIGKFVVPTWISANPHPLQLHVSRQGELLGVENLSNRHYYIFGRNRGQCNKVLDHPSISKQHAVIVHGSPGAAVPALLSFAAQLFFSHVHICVPPISQMVPPPRASSISKRRMERMSGSQRISLSEYRPSSPRP